MNNIITYTQENLTTFEQIPFNSVDSLVLSSAAYIHFPDIIPEVSGWKGIRLQELYLAEFFEEMFHNIPLKEDTKQLFFALAASPRFRNIRVMGYVEQFDLVSEKQFSATTFMVHPGLYYIAFRGTDSTLIGWKEDFNMSFQESVPAQRLAVKYVQEFCEVNSAPLYLGGHSKGGNLAILRRYGIITV